MGLAEVTGGSRDPHEVALSRSPLLAAIGARALAWASRRPLHTNVYGVARSLLGASTLATLVFSSTASVFRGTPAHPTYPLCSNGTQYGLFCLAGSDHLEIARWIAVAVLIVVVVGWRPRLTGVLHWYVTASFATSALMVDGGDQVAQNLSLLLIPITLTDSRRSHWDTSIASTATAVGRRTLFDTAAALFARSCYLIIRFQVAGIYFEAATAKMRVEEWRDGTAVYYWFTDPAFGLWEPIKSGVMPLLATGWVVAALTWGAIALEMALFLGLVASHQYRQRVLVAGVAFHAAIGLIHGIPSFAIAMFAALILYLRPFDEPFALRRTRRACSAPRFVRHSLT